MPTSISDGAGLRSPIQAAAREEGFDVAGVGRLSDLDPQIGERLDGFIAAGHHGDMAWMATTGRRRRHPAALWPEARSVIMLGASYAPGIDPLERLAERHRGVIASYAKGRDYHDVIKGALKRVAGRLQPRLGGDVKVFVDTAPLMEKPLATLAGLGWQGKHTNLVSRHHGSWLLLGAILTTAALSPDQPEADHCGSCRRCLEICPTRAFPAPYRLDARRCISYLTIEHSGPIARDLRPLIGNRIFGCDDCLAVCPWNKFAEAGRAGILSLRLKARPGLDDPQLGELLGFDEGRFRSHFAGTAIKRTGWTRFLRNVLIAAGNSGDPALLAAVRARLTSDVPLVRGAAVWALGRLAPRADLVMLARTHRPSERDPTVEEEWRAALEAQDASP